jgi:hypothetical protein
MVNSAARLRMISSVIASALPGEDFVCELRHAARSLGPGERFTTPFRFWLDSKSPT